jgi:hypothetical protein
MYFGKNVDSVCSSNHVPFAESKAITAQPSVKRAMASASRPNRVPQARNSGLIVRGRIFYVRWMIPRKLQPVLGKTHFVRSLKTGRRDEAVRQARIVSGDFEKWLRAAEGGSGFPIVSEIAPITDPVAKAAMTLKEVFTLFIK